MGVAVAVVSTASFMSTTSVQSRARARRRAASRRTNGGCRIELSFNPIPPADGVRDAERADEAHPRPGIVRSTPFEPRTRRVERGVDVERRTRQVLRSVYECGTRGGCVDAIRAAERTGERAGDERLGSVALDERGVLRGAVGVVGVGERGAGVREREEWGDERGKWV